jgi:hypothetical protein
VCSVLAAVLFATRRSATRVLAPAVNALSIIVRIAHATAVFVIRLVVSVVSVVPAWVTNPAIAHKRIPKIVFVETVGAINWDASVAVNVPEETVIKCNVPVVLAQQVNVTRRVRAILPVSVDHAIKKTPVIPLAKSVVVIRRALST